MSPALAGTFFTAKSPGKPRRRFRESPGLRPDLLIHKLRKQTSHTTAETVPLWAHKLRRTRNKKETQHLKPSEPSQEALCSSACLGLPPGGQRAGDPPARPCLCFQLHDVMDKSLPLLIITCLGMSHFGSILFETLWASSI